MMSNFRGDVVRARLRKKFRRLLGLPKDAKASMVSTADEKLEDVEEFDVGATKQEPVGDETDKVSVAATENLSRCSSFRTNSSAAAPSLLKKSVSFFEYAEMVTVESLDEYDPEIIEQLWHKADDLQGFRREAIAEVRSFMRKHSVEDVFMARRLLYNGSGVPKEVRNKFRKQADCDATADM